MAALHAARNYEPIEFTRLRALVGATDGNLGSHLNALQAAGYIRLEKDVAAKRSRTRASITAKGAAAFHAHIAFLRQVIDIADGALDTCESG